MGACISSPPQRLSRRSTNPFNPIFMIQENYSIDKLRDRWNSQQLIALENKFKTTEGNIINFDSFLNFFPKLTHFQKKTQQKVYQLMAYQNKGYLSRQQLVFALTIIKNVQKNSDFSPLLFYVYTSDKQHKKMTSDQLKRFEKENKEYRVDNDIEELQEVLSAQILCQIQPYQAPKTAPNQISNSKQMYSAQIKTKNTNHFDSNSSSFLKLQKNNADPSLRSKSSATQIITSHKFTAIFQNYNLKAYQILFSSDSRQEQQNLVKILAKEGLNRQKGDKVYLIEYKWFLAWRAYVQSAYYTRLLLNENNELPSQPNAYMSLSRKKSLNQSPLKKQHAVRPERINNHILCKNNNKKIQLRPSLVQFQHYICVAENIWSHLLAIYGGGPTFQRVFPQIYAKTIIKVQVDNQNAVFIHNSAKKSILKENVKARASGLLNDKESSIIYYKYPGKTNWIAIQNMHSSLQEIFDSQRTYVTSVDMNLQKQFEQMYNINQGHKGKCLKQRLLNYGSEVNVYVDGVLTKAQVVQILDQNEIVVEFINQQGNTQEQNIKIDNKLRELNPSELYRQDYINQLAGLNNICNTCYENAVIQCLIRTPAFGGYLQSEKFKDVSKLTKSKRYSSKGEQIKEQSQDYLLEQLYLIYAQSKSNEHTTIDTRPFKRVFDKHCPFFQGNSQHDAQEFLISLLSRISEEIKNIRKEYGVSSQTQIKEGKLAQNKSSKINEKVVKFFSGVTKAVTNCKQCQNQGVRQQPFFTYSLSLPQMHRMEYYYCMIRKSSGVESTVPVRYGMTLSRKTTISEFLEAVSEQQRISIDKLVLYAVFNNQLLNKLDGSTYQNQVNHHLNFNSKLVVYEVDYLSSPTYFNYRDRQFYQKSVKVQLRQRLYSDKTNQYKLIYLPFLLQIKENMKWKDVQQQIQKIIKKLQSNYLQQQEYHERELRSTIHRKKEQSPGNVSYINSSSISYLHSTPKKTQNMNSQINVNRQLKYKGKQTPKNSLIQNETSKWQEKYRIRIIKVDHSYRNSCAFCKQELVKTRKSRNDQVCHGCYFSNQTPLFEQIQFRNINDNIIIVVDWTETAPEIQQIINHHSYDEAFRKAEARFEKLEVLLQNSFTHQEQIELTCQKQNCKHKEALRTQKIQVPPNILLLHLKRFTYEDNMLVKLTNNVVYQHQIRLPNSDQDYQLYGSVVHIGNGVGGHYISYVKVGHRWYKCDDSKVSLAKPGHQIDPNAYILFYKKKKFEPSLMTLSF